MHRGADLGLREGPLPQQLAREREDGPEVNARAARGELGVPRELGVEDRLHQRAQRQAVVRAHQVDRRAHDDGPDGPPPLDQAGQLSGPEAVEPRPQRRVGVVRHLRLEADEVLHGVEDGHLGAAQQQLAGERGAVQGPRAERLDRHGAEAYHRRGPPAAAGGRAGAPSARGRRGSLAAAVLLRARPPGSRRGRARPAAAPSRRSARTSSPRRSRRSRSGRLRRRRRPPRRRRARRGRAPASRRPRPSARLLGGARRAGPSRRSRCSSWVGCRARPISTAEPQGSVGRA